MSRGGFYEGSKNNFAFVMEWVDRAGKADRARVEGMCNLTRDQDQWDWVKSSLSGFRVSYAPSQGGMTLIDPEGELPLDHMYHVLAGDLQRQQSARTTNLRRIPTWKEVGQRAAAAGDMDLARLWWQGENEIETTGFVSGTVSGKIMQALAARGF